MVFCSECGTECQDGNFCNSCGARLAAPETDAPAPAAAETPVSPNRGEGLAFFDKDDEPSDAAEEERVSRFVSASEGGAKWSEPRVVTRPSFHKPVEDEAEMLRRERRKMEERLRAQGKMPANRGRFEGDDK